MSRERDTSGDEPYDLGKAVCVRQTAKAVLVELDGVGQTWIPKSCLHDDSEVFDDTDNRNGKVVVKTWWARSNGLS